MAYDGFLISLLSGAAAGTSTDLLFFPIDTIKTRLQAKGGFFYNGGYRGIYKGLGSAVIASAPSASLFFVTYDYMKVELKQMLLRYNKNNQSEWINTVTHMTASSLGEISACMVRVPAEVIKQRTQTSISKNNSTSWQTFKTLLKNENGQGFRNNFYRGWASTILREIPFTCIQFPLYEYLKKAWLLHDIDILSEKSEMISTDSLNTTLSPWKGAICGSIAGGIAAATTTPLDVLKTRIMLSDKSMGTIKLVQNLYHEEGMKVFFKGVGPRSMWISAGGAVFLGVYEITRSVLINTKSHQKPFIE
ncbi:hypothetical protein TPHA_0B03710 [Tetrapisispora phaffii CBS 4417]|uniref:Putative mitochondrial carrier protein PET8 n=1 Tax=Tetrapisispora phaffii (strain ATCC 24235 / CBS 4417 / NBRC 1672 / NRRL Y-8282 / UCD 70-5) TaxID=1071381 RepID=G8BPW2_TETPH|nr:hypothetical protein TPHA_0B03710 [Tetrapisispora phaffii CBS 4417]CCE62043.1 hypothetical protein TPHA_0B03710 [Tetrapisispora phaffii CBS 4417]